MGFEMNDRQENSARLNTTQFLTLRSIARESWDMRIGTFEWRFNGRWVRLSRDDERNCYSRARRSASELVARGLVELVTVRCCPGTSCHANDRHEFRLTKRGNSLLQKANATSRAATTGVPLDRR
jgi:hypothetical protein